MSPRWPITIVALPPVKCGAVLWRMGGLARVTVAVKASFGMVHEGAARLVGAEDLLVEDHIREPMSGAIDEASDLAPYLPSAGVVLIGHAYAPGGRPTSGMAVRLAVFRDERALLDKTLHVFGYRAPVPNAAPQPFQKIPLTWDRAFGGPSIEDNPAGSGSLGSHALPNILDPIDAARPAGFGPVARAWGPRRRLLGGADPAALSRAPLEIPEGFDFRWFHAAPPDQQIELLRGDEWIVLEGLHPALPGVQTRLPPVRAEARVTLPGAPANLPIELALDTLIIDADRQSCSLLWRGHVAVDHLDAAALARVVVHAGLEMPGRPIPWPGNDQAPVDLRARGEHPAAAIDRSAPGHHEAEGAAPEIAAKPATTFGAHLPSFHVDDDDDDFGGGTKAVSIKGVTMPALPFKQAPVPGPRTEVAPRIDDGALPFRAPAPPPAALAEPPRAADPPAIERSPAPPPAAPVSASASVPAPPAAAITIAEIEAVVIPDDELEEHTSAVDLRKAQERPIAPFAVAAPGTRTPAPALPLPGAPWSPHVPVTPLPPMPADEATTSVDPLDDIAPPRLADIDAALADDPTPPPTEPRAPAIAPPVAPRVRIPSPPVSVSDVPSFLEGPTIVETGELALTAVDLVPPPIGAPDTGSIEVRRPAPSLRETVAARLASGEGLAGLDLSRADLSGLDFRRAILGNAKLGGARLEGCSFEGARLGDADLRDADLTGANLSGADLSRADLSRAQLSRARFDGANVSDAVLVGARGAGASFADAVARRASFARGAWDGAIFDRLDGTMVDFTEALIDGASFRDASLVALRLDGAHGAGATFDGARLPDARAEGASLIRCSFARIDAKAASFEQSTLDGSCFEDAYLEDATFSGATCARAVFARARARNGNFERVGGDSADFSGADLEDGNLRQARFQAANLSGAVLRGITGNRVDLSRARLVGADLDSAVLRGGKLCAAVLARATLEGADLRDADLERANLFEARRATAKMSGANTRDVVEVDPDL